MKYIIQTLITKAFQDTDDDKAEDAFKAMNSIDWGAGKDDPIIQGIKLILKNKGVQNLLDIEYVATEVCRDIVHDILGV